jgi:hypothetical protein
VVSQKSEARGTMKGQGKPLCKVDYVPMGEKVEVGETFYTSGDDRVFPRGFAVGVVKSVQSAQPFQEIWVEPSGMQHGLEDVLIILEAVHQTIPTAAPVNQQVYIAPAPPQQNQNQANQAATGTAAGAQAAPAGTEADKLRAIYQSVGEAQNHTYGSGPPGTKPPDFTRLPSNPGQAPQAGPSNPAAPAAAQPAGGRAAAPAGAPSGPTGGRQPANAATGRPQPPASAGTGTEGTSPSRMSRQAAGAPSNPASPGVAPGADKPAGQTVRPPAPPAKQ